MYNMEYYVDTPPPPPPNTNKHICIMKMQHGMGILRTKIMTIYKLLALYCSHYKVKRF